MPLEVVKQPAMAMIPLPKMGQTGLPTVLMAPTVAGMMQPFVTPWVEVAMAVIDES